MRATGALAGGRRRRTQHRHPPAGPRPLLGVNDVELTLREYAGTVGINQVLKGGDSL